MGRVAVNAGVRAITQVATRDTDRPKVVSMGGYLSQSGGEGSDTTRLRFEFGESSRFIDLLLNYHLFLLTRKIS